MHKSFQTIYTQLQEISGDDSGSSTSGQLRRFYDWINQTQSIVCATNGGKYAFLEKTATETSTASGSSYDLPADFRRMIALKTTVSTTDYTPIPVHSPELWDAIDAMNLSDSDVTQFYHVRGNHLLVAPAFSSASNTITYTYRKRVKEMSADDYTTGNVAAATNADLTVTGTGTTWTNAMEGRFIRIRGTNGDGQWYEIETFVSTTSITLAREYQGDTFSSATDAYVIGEMSVIPPDYHDLLIWRPLAIYYAMHEQPSMAEMYWRMYDGGYEAGYQRDAVGGLLGTMIEEEKQGTNEGAIVVSLDELQERIYSRDVNTPPSTTITFSDL